MRKMKNIAIAIYKFILQKIVNFGLGYGIGFFFTSNYNLTASIFYMTIVSSILCFILILFYDKIKIDLFSIEAFKK